VGVRVEVEAVEVAVDRAELRLGRAFGADHLQALVPGLVGGLLDVLEAAPLELELQVVPCLVGADERRRDPQGHV
jgi:hypothetical protein